MGWSEARGWREWVVERLDERRGENGVVGAHGAYLLH